MRRIIIDSDIITVKNLKYFSPDHRCCHQVLSARPLISVKKHRTVFNRNAYFLFFCITYNWNPDLFYQFQIFFYGLCLITTDKCCYQINSKFLTCIDHFVQMFYVRSSFFQISIHGVRIECKRRNLNVFALAIGKDLGCFRIIQCRYINVADTCIASFCFCIRPAGYFYTFISHLRDSINHLFEIIIFQYCTD